jgi:hypothetical protein
MSSSLAIAPLSKYIAAADSASADKGPIVSLPSDCNDQEDNVDSNLLMHSLRAMEHQIAEFEVCRY